LFYFFFTTWANVYTGNEFLKKYMHSLITNKAVCPFYYTKDIEIYLEVGLEDFS